jgi:hypothetical protein
MLHVFFKPPKRRRGLKARFAAVRVRIADGPPQRIKDKGQQHLPGEEAWLIGEHRSSGEKKYYLANLSATTDLRTLAATIKARWICEQAVLGRGLISTQPNADGCELDEGQIIGCQLVISSRDTPTLLDLVEEPFDQVARAVQVRAEADRVPAIFAKAPS